MDVNAIFLYSLTGVQMGALIALIGLGLTLIFGTLGVVNFAHGALYMIAAYVAVLVSSHIGFVAAIFLVPLVLFAVGVALERGLIQFFYDRPHTDQILVTFGAAIVLEEAMKWGFGANNIPFPRPGWGNGVVFLNEYFPFLEGFVAYPKWNLLLVVVTVVTVFALFALLQFTRFGLVVRAGMRDPEMLRFLGVNVTQKFMIVFGLGAAIAGIAATFGGSISQVFPGVGMQLLVPSFLVVVIGGMGSLPGALIAALLLGLAQSFTVGAAATVTDPSWKDFFTGLQQIVVYLVAVIVLLARPRGLMGKKGVFE